MLKMSQKISTDQFSELYSNFASTIFLVFATLFIFLRTTTSYYCISFNSVNILDLILSHGYNWTNT